MTARTMSFPGRTESARLTATRFQFGPPLPAGARVRDVEPVPVARPTRELGVGVPTVAAVGERQW